MNTLDKVKTGRWKVLLRIAAVAGVLMAGPAAWSGLAPTLLLLLQILLGLGQLCVTILRIS
jgi:hypothetical protein